jgi:hypothetical protein
MNKELKDTINALTDSYELEIRYLDEAIQRVRDLHQPRVMSAQYCRECGAFNPCPTTRALGGENNKHNCDFILDLDGQVTCTLCGCRDDY